MRAYILHLALLMVLPLLPGCRKDLPETVPPEIMEKIYREVRTPHKYGLVLVPENPELMIDCPTIFRSDSSWIMSFIFFDGRGYETCLAESRDLLDWQIRGKIMAYSDTGDWDMNQKAGYLSLVDYDWGGEYRIRSHDGYYWMSYFGGNTRGYERGLLSIGMARTKGDPAGVHPWERLKEPVLGSRDEDARWYDNSTMYKSSVIRDREELTGHPFVMYYNARGDSLNPDRGAERISMAVSDDLIHWTRYGEAPLINHHKGISGDAVIQKIGDVYVMFYFGAFWPEMEEKAFNRFACSYDLVNWTDWEGEHLIEPSEDYDKLFAHKSCVLKHDGKVYHFYCAVDSAGNRGLALACSENLGKSPLTFPSPAKQTD